MNDIIEALAEPAQGGGWIVRAPHVGIYRGRPRPGGRRGAGETVGTLTVLGRTGALVLPASVEGIVTGSPVEEKSAPVEYGQPLFGLAPVPAAQAGPAAPGPVPAGPSGTGAGASALPAGAFAVTCPIDGIFYRRPSPGAPPYVETGETVESGRTIGLIEAMKSFNAVTYGGPGLPARAIIQEIRAADASEVRQGAILIVVRGG